MKILQESCRERGGSCALTLMSQLPNVASAQTATRCRTASPPSELPTWNQSPKRAVLDRSRLRILGGPIDVIPGKAFGDLSGGQHARYAGPIWSVLHRGQNSICRCVPASFIPVLGSRLPADEMLLMPMANA